MKHIRINFLTIYLLLILLLCGYIKTGIIIFTIVFVHELGHKLMGTILGYKVLEITIYPFGGITKFEKDINTKIKDELLIAVSGIIFQIILGLIIYKLHLSTDTKLIFDRYNRTILLFNLLPIIPLDGSIILKSILNIFLSFKNSYILYILISIVTMIIYTLFNYWNSLNNYLIISLFLLKLSSSIKDYKYIYNRFLLERYLKDYKFNKISTKKGNLDILKIDTYQYFKGDKKVVSEKRKLQELFDNKAHF